MVSNEHDSDVVVPVEQTEGEVNGGRSREDDTPRHSKETKEGGERYLLRQTCEEQEPNLGLCQGGDQERALTQLQLPGGQCQFCCSHGGPDLNRN